MASSENTKNGNGGTLGFEAELFKAADKLRGNMEPSDYKHVALGLIFLKYISDAFEARHKALLAEDVRAARTKMNTSRTTCSGYRRRRAGRICRPTLSCPPSAP